MQLYRMLRETQFVFWIQEDKKKHYKDKLQIHQAAAFDGPLTPFKVRQNVSGPLSHYKNRLHYFFGRAQVGLTHFLGTFFNAWWLLYFAI